MIRLLAAIERCQMNDFIHCVRERPVDSRDGNIPLGNPWRTTACRLVISSTETDRLKLQLPYTMLLDIFEVSSSFSNQRNIRLFV
jgi:hypothetical protein